LRRGARQRGAGAGTETNDNNISDNLSDKICAQLFLDVQVHLSTSLGFCQIKDQPLALSSFLAQVLESYAKDKKFKFLCMYFRNMGGVLQLLALQQLI
jgi:hypothetical protein